jgi:hypothetical protein
MRANAPEDIGIAFDPKSESIKICDPAFPTVRGCCVSSLGASQSHRKHLSIVDFGLGIAGARF